MLVSGRKGGFIAFFSGKDNMLDIFQDNYLLGCHHHWYHMILGSAQIEKT